jgi:hypothetical protein
VRRTLKRVPWLIGFGALGFALAWCTLSSQRERKPTVPVTENAAAPFAAPPAHADSVHRRGGCGSRGGPGYRLANGRCAGWRAR